MKSVLVMMLALASGAIAQTATPSPITIGVLTIAGPRRTLANNITALLDVNLSSNSHFLVLDRSELSKVLEEQALGKSGMITQDTAARIGRLTGAKILVTGREFNADGHGNIVVIANVIGVETGRVFSQTVQGSTTNLVALIAGLSGKIVQIIADHSINLLMTAVGTQGDRLDKIIQNAGSKPQPAVLIQINADGSDSIHQTAQNELNFLFEKAGFIVVDRKLDRKPDIIITGDALATSGTRQGSLFSGRATLEIKARERTTGKILVLDLQQGAAADISQQLATCAAVKNAADELAIRLIPALAK